MIDQNRGLELLLTYNFVTANSVPLSVEVYDESEQKILTCTVGGTQDTGCTISDDPNNASIKQIKVSLTGSTVSSTRVYIRVARADTSTDTVNYELKLTPNFTVQCVDDNLEDDDTRQTAKTLTVPQESWQAQTPEWVYCTSDAADWKKIDLEAGDVLSVDLVHFISSTLPEPLSITLYDKDGSVVANGLRENPLSGFPATLGYGYSTWLDSGSSTITISGTYYLEIKPKDPGKKKDTSYKLTTHVVKNTDLPCGSTNAADGEPNNTPLNARTISSGVNYTSLSLCKNNPDWFVSTISTPKVDIKLTFDSAVSNVEVLVLTPTLDVLTTKVLTGETSFTYTTSAEGTYFVGVRPQAGYSSTTGYSLELAPR